MGLRQVRDLNGLRQPVPRRAATGERRIGMPCKESVWALFIRWIVEGKGKREGGRGEGKGGWGSRIEAAAATSSEERRRERERKQCRLEAKGGSGRGLSLRQDKS